MNTIFDFALTEDEMNQIAGMNTHDEGTVNFADVDFVNCPSETYG